MKLGILDDQSLESGEPLSLVAGRNPGTIDDQDIGLADIYDLEQRAIGQDVVNSKLASEICLGCNLQVGQGRGRV